MSKPNEFKMYMKAIFPITIATTPHLDEAELLAYCQKQMPAAQWSAAQTHLVGCAQCLQRFRDLNDFFAPPREEEKELSEAQYRRIWNQLQPRLQPKTAFSAAPIPKKENWIDRFNWRSEWALAAGLLLVGLTGFLGWQWQQERQTRQQIQQEVIQLQLAQAKQTARFSQLEQTIQEQLHQEQAKTTAAETKAEQLAAQRNQPLPQNLAFATIRLSTEKGNDDGLHLTLPADAEAITLRLLKSRPYEFPSYAIEWSGSGIETRTIAGLRPIGEDGALSMTFNRAGLRTGKYRLVLFGKRGGQKQKIEECQLTLTFAR